MIFLIPLCVTVFALWFCYLIGQLIFFLPFKQNLENSSNAYLIVIQKTFLGLVTIIFLYSVYITKGITINILFILIVFLFYSYSKFFKNVLFVNKPKTNYWKLELFVLFKTTFVLLIFTILLFLLFNDFQRGLIATNTSPDHYYYTYYATKMVEFGIEGTNFTLSTLTSPAAQFRTPYHYFDFWMIALFQKMSLGKIGLAQIYSFCFIPFISALAWLSLNAVFSLFNSKISLLNSVILFLLTTFLSPVEFHFLEGINLLHAPKLYCSIVVTCIAFCYFYNRQIIIGFLFLASLPLMNILALPVICVSAGLYSLFLFYKKRNKEGLFLLICFLLLGLSILLFYQFFGSASNKINIGDYSLKQLIMGGTVYCFKIFGRLVIAFMPIVLCLLVLHKKIKNIYHANKQLIGVSLLIVIVGYLESIIMWNIYDSGQIRYYPSNILIGIFFTVIVAIISKEYDLFKSNVYLKLTYLSIIVFSVFSFISLILNNKKVAEDTFVSQTFINEIKENIEPNTTYGYIYHPNRVNTSLWANNYNLVLDNLNFLSLIPNNFYKVSLNTIINLDSIPVQFKGLAPIIGKGDFYKFSKTINTNNLNFAQVEFIKENKIRYLVTSKKENLPTEILSLVEKKIEDNYSKKCFFILKKL